MGPVLFNTYIAPLSNIAVNHGVTDQKYADDEQLVLSFRPDTTSNVKNAYDKMEKCIHDIRLFLHNNKLSNNADKTEFILIGSKHNLNSIHRKNLMVNNITLNSMEQVRNLGVIFDKEMKMDKQVAKMCQKTFLNIKNIAYIRKNLSKNDTKTVVNALVIPHLDYGNAVLTGISAKNIRKLQVAQNSAARLIERLRKFDRISHIRKDLHWLPIQARIDYKVIYLTWKTLNNQAPKYLRDMIKDTTHVRNMRSNNQRNLDMQRCINNYGTRAFSVIAPKLWNKLPVDIKNIKENHIFKKRLKTHLFKLHYENA